MSVKRTTKPKVKKAEIEALKAMPDSTIDYSDIPETDAAFWAEAIERRRTKELISIRLDPDLLEWLRQKPRYQTLVNDILRAYVDHEKKREADAPRDPSR